MEQTVSPAQNLLNRWRAKVKTLAGNIFSPPYLPSNLILFFLLTVFTDWAVTVTRFTPDYWQDIFRVDWAFSNDYEVSPVEWVVLLGVYLSIAVFCLTVFNYRWSLLGWIVAETYHFYGMGNWLDGCYYGQWSLAAGKFCETFDKRIFWILATIIVGFVVATNLQPNGSLLPKTSRGKLISRLSISFATLWIFLLLGGIIISAKTPTVGWIPLQLEYSPPPLQHAAHAYDSLRNRLIIFGGSTIHKNGSWVFTNQTWEWDGNQWRNVSPLLKDSPQVRDSAGMAYDEKRGRVVMYGGLGRNGALCDTWEWDGKTWSGTCPPGCPGARYGHEMYYDQTREKVVLYGGYDDKTFFKDAWEWDGKAWTEIEISGVSPGATTYALAYNPQANYAFGLLSGSPGGSWIFKDTQWTHVISPQEPSNRGGMRLAYEPSRKLFVTFGGFITNYNLNDTWMFDGETWSQFTEGSTQPPLRAHTVLWYDEVRMRVMLFGGHNDNTVYNDTWELVLPQK
jgi:hypothetical protein